MRHKRRIKQSPREPSRALSLSQLPSDLLSARPLASSEIPWFLRLYAQVLRRAAVDYVLYYGHHLDKLGKIGDEAYSWLFEDNKEFVEMCGQLSLSVAVVREQVRGLSEEEARALRGLDFEEEAVMA